jgi:hypothetical protein
MAHAALLVGDGATEACRQGAVPSRTEYHLQAMKWQG